MISEQVFNYLLYAWMGMAVVVFFILKKVVVPYGRHTSDSWGLKINNRVGWVIMEIPVLIVFSWFFFSGNVTKSAPVYVFYFLFAFHYINRIFIFPVKIKSKSKQMPVVIVLFAICFNLINGFFNGFWLGSLTHIYDHSWFYDPRFVTGFLLFIVGMYLNITSDNKLIRLRKGGKSGYYIPHGGLFNYVSSPNLLGEIIEWTGWAILCWNMPAASFALWTMANLIPRAQNHHEWYIDKFSDYPANRKAIFPKIL